MAEIDLIITCAEKFYYERNVDPNGRHRSWEYCYKAFYDARNTTFKNYDYLSLQLAFYLASWGMYRGSTFLLQKDYKIHTPVVEEILKKDYDCLFDIGCMDLRKENTQCRLRSLYDFIDAYYGEIRKNVKKTNIKEKVSTILITKILMGTLGCVPAYDRCFVMGVKNLEICKGTYNIESLLELVGFYEDNYLMLENIRKKYIVYDLKYPQMKLLDMGLWQLGYELENREKGDRNG